MELLVLFGIVALLLFGPRRSGRMPGRFEIGVGVIFLVWLALALGLGRLWEAVLGPLPRF